MVSKKDQEKIKKLMDAAEAKFDNKDYEGAIKDHDEAIRLNPKDSDVWYNRGAAKAHLEQFEDAIKDYDKAIRLNPENSDAWYNRGNAKADLERFEDAIKDYDKAIRLNPENSGAWNNRGAAKAGLKRFGDAIKDHDEAIRLNPENSGAWSNRGTAKADLERFEDAIKDYEEAIRLNPEDSRVWNNRGVTKAKLEQFEDAIKDYEEAIRLNPENNAAINNLAAVKAQIKANKVIEERLGSFENTSVKFVEEVEKLEEKEIGLKKEMKWILWFVFVIICIVIGIKLSGFENLIDQIQYTNPDNFIYVQIFSHLESLGIILLLTLPFFIRLKIITRDWEETRILIHDYKRHAYLRADMDLRQSTFDSTRRQELQESIIYNLMLNGPVETLLNLKNKKNNKINTHPIGDIIDSCKKAFKNKKKMDEDSP